MDKNSKTSRNSCSDIYFRVLLSKHVNSKGCIHTRNNILRCSNVIRCSAKQNGILCITNKYIINMLNFKLSNAFPFRFQLYLLLYFIFFFSSKCKTHPQNVQVSVQLNHIVVTYRALQVSRYSDRRTMCLKIWGLRLHILLFPLKCPSLTINVLQNDVLFSPRTFYKALVGILGAVQYHASWKQLT